MSIKQLLHHENLINQHRPAASLPSLSTDQVDPNGQVVAKAEREVVVHEKQTNDSPALKELAQSTKHTPPTTLQNQVRPLQESKLNHVWHYLHSTVASLQSVCSRHFSSRQTSQCSREDHEKVWSYVGTSVVGTRHAKKKQSCQDACQIIELPTGELVIAVADGAGSALQSQQGARVAVQTSVDFLRKAIPLRTLTSPQEWQELIVNTYTMVKARLVEYALNNKTTPKEFATTLMVVVLTDKWVASGMVGDGAIVALTDVTTLVAMTSPQRGEYVNSTTFVTSMNAFQKLSIAVWNRSLAGVAVLTDGLLHLAVDEQNAPSTQFFEPFFKFLRNSKPSEANDRLAQFLASDRVCKRTDDDKTLVVALRKILNTDSKVYPCNSKQETQEGLS
ncbi:MAG: PP2C family serine/threonine-protein phosphatase [Caldilineaceae bacterium]